MTLFTTPPLPPKIIQALHELGINSVEAMQHTGIIATFLLLKSCCPGITEHLLWQLVVLAEQRPDATLTAMEKQQWHQRIKQHPPVRRFPATEDMQHWMSLALVQAQLAFEANEVPVGAIVVHQHNVIGHGFNQCIGHHNVSHHAEIQALTMAGQALKNYRLDQCDVYVSLEPCAMCASALIQARVQRVIYAAPESKSGAAGSVLNLFNQRQLNTHTAVLGGILATDSLQLLRRFFQSRR